MQDWVREKLKRLEELYPAQRLEQSKARWQALWRGDKPDNYPFLLKPLTVNYYDDVLTKEEGLRRYLDEFLARGFVQDDFIPAFFPGCRQGTIPSMFGAKEVVVGQDHTCERILHEIEDVDQLPDPVIAQDNLAGFWLDMQHYYLEECEGQIPVHVCDMQGPMDVGGQLMGYDHLFVSAYEDEDRFSLLMHKLTQAYEMLWDAQQALLGDHFIGTHLYGWDYVPAQNGATLSADCLVMLSPNFFNTHYARRLEALARKYGGLSVHSCGNFAPVVSDLAAVPGVKAVNASQMTPDQLYAAGWPKDKMIIAFETAPNACALMRRGMREGLKLDLCVDWVWPADASGKPFSPDEWSTRDKTNIVNQCAMLREAAAGN